MPLRAFLLLTAICFVWALNVVVSRLVVEGLGVPPLAYAAMRSLLVLLALLRWLRPLPASLPKVLLVTFAVSGGSFALLFVGLQDATPSASAVVNLSGAPLTVLFAIAILGERIGWRRGVGIGLTFAGVGVAIASPSGWSSSYGLLFVFASALVGALGSVFLKRIELESIRLQAWAAVASVAVLMPLSLLLEHGQVAAVAAGGWELIAALVFSAGVVSLGAHTLYFDLLKGYDANLIAPLTLMTPMFTIAAGAAITGDRVGPLLLLGAAIAAGGVLVIVLRPSRKLFKPLLVRPRL
ncbi:DMT family transporter [Croceibacterium aestuarii]|uniref:DMT family transporter n=1 Tax=Croceibacterium aestuarii TaxID=3064139 RepID=UPI00272E7E2E|nr:DMT family transporter [Croceibacterium sp. D39]